MKILSFSTGGGWHRILFLESKNRLRSRCTVAWHVCAYGIVSSAMGRPPLENRGRGRNNPANCRQDFQVRESHLIRTTGHGTPESINPWRILSLSISFSVYLSRNKEPDSRGEENRPRYLPSLSLSLLPRNPGCICMRKSRRIENRRILVTFGLSDGRSWKEFLDFRERNELREAWIEEETYDASNLNEISNSFFDRDNKNVFFK